MLGKIVINGTDPNSLPYHDPNKQHLVKEVSIKVNVRNVIGCSWSVLAIFYLLCVLAPTFSR